MDLTAQQLSAIGMFKEHNVMVLTGGPGTGKTTTCKEIIRIAREEGKKVALCAPSGKAAKKLQEATGEYACTIHKLLEARGGPGGFVFMRDAQNPLAEDVVICDEVSMVPNELMARLLEATQAGQKVVFVGDQDQLPSVGAGAVLRDFLESGVIPFIELTIIHRNAGKIVEACHQIKNGKFYSPSKELDLPIENLRHIETKDPQRIVDIITEIISDKISKRGYDPIWDIQVLSPYNDQGPLSCAAINNVLQEKLNPNEPVFFNEERYSLKPGDKAIQIRNETVKYEDGFDYVVNGDICKIISIDRRQIRAEFFYPTREVILSRVDNHLLLAYAITCHKFQGSEAPVVIIPVHASFNRFITRPWIYTAISRAQNICITVGQFSAVKHAIQRAYSNDRVTRLQKRLRMLVPPRNTGLNREGRPKRVVKKLTPAEDLPF